VSVSLGYVLVARGNKHAQRDMRLVGFGPEASLDEVCRVLAATGPYQFEVLRHNALVAMADLVSVLDLEKDALFWLTTANKRLGVWVAACHAKKALSFATPNKGSARAVGVVELWCAGLASTSDVIETAADAERAISARHQEINGSVYRLAARSADAVVKSVCSNISNFDSFEAGYAATYCVYAANAAGLLASIVGLTADALQSFPVWQGDPSEDRWPMRPGLLSSRNRKTADE